MKTLHGDSIVACSYLLRTSRFHAYDRAGIMSLAVGAARSQQARTGEAWTVCMSAALNAAWHSAKVARLTRAH